MHVSAQKPMREEVLDLPRAGNLGIGKVYLPGQ